jgi:hypothetical protein
MFQQNTETRNAHEVTKNPCCISKTFLLETVWGLPKKTKNNCKKK